jgi:hypothetical protein
MSKICNSGAGNYYHSEKLDYGLVEVRHESNSVGYETQNTREGVLVAIRELANCDKKMNIIEQPTAAFSKWISDCLARRGGILFFYRYGCSKNCEYSYQYDLVAKLIRRLTCSMGTCEMCHETVWRRSSHA